MKRFALGVAVFGLATGVALFTGCGPAPTTAKPTDKMSGTDKMGGDKMSGTDKMKDDKMKDDKMKDGDKK